MTTHEFALRLQHACASVMAAEQELTEIDSKFGDADHGLTMTKIAKAISAAVEASDGGIQTMLDDAAMAVMSLNGGSAVPLWNTWLDGMQEAAPEGDTVDIAGIQAIFAGGFAEIDDMSGAKLGDKTILDALYPMADVLEERVAAGDELGVAMGAAAAKAREAAEATSGIQASVGRAKWLGERAAANPDGGAILCAVVAEGLA